ncbi:MAG: radical SAM protein [Candidatus Omnitrophota bacterium]
MISKPLVFIHNKLAGCTGGVVKDFLKNTYRNYIKKTIRCFSPMFDSSIMLALTYKCQCRCEHCGSNLHERPGSQELTSPEIFRLIDDFEKAGGWSIYFFGGEPLIVPELFSYIEYVKRKKMLAKLDTNGFLLDENMVKRLKASGLNCISVSIDSPRAASHDKLRGMQGLFDRAMNGVKLCLEHGLDCYITTYATKENIVNGDLSELIGMAKSIGVRVRILSSICSGRWAERRDVVLSGREIGMLRKLIEKDKVFWEHESVDRESAPFRCAALEKDFFYVSSYGDIQPCCYVPAVFGNIREQPFYEGVKKMRSSGMFRKNRRLNDCMANSVDAGDAMQADKK